MKPYSTDESLNNRQKRLFNTRLSGLRTVMSECIFGQWKSKFPILKQMRHSLKTSQKIIIATAVLFNISTLWGEEDIYITNNDADDAPNQNIPIPARYDRQHVKLRGQAKRDEIRMFMAP